MISSNGRPRSLKGKERAISQEDAEQIFTYTSHPKSDSSEDDGQSFGDYESALEAALDSDDLDEQGHEKTFIYTGDDDEEMQELRELARSNSIGPKNGRMTQAPPEPPWHHSADAESGNPSRPRSAASSSARIVDSAAMRSTQAVPAVGPQKDHDGDITASTINLPSPSTHSRPSTILDRAASSPVLPTQLKAGTVPNGLPYRRPPMNPLVSRLRSTSGAPLSFSGPNSRSVSQTSLASSLGLANGTNGFANESPRNSFYGNPKLAGSSASISRRSSVSHGPGQHRRLRADQSAGDSESVSAKDLYSEAHVANSATLSPDDGTKSFEWVSLSKITQRLRINRSGTRESLLGMPTVMKASGIICIGTAKGWTMVFDYSQTLRCVCGNDAIVKQSGAVSALAISTDQTYLAVGHVTGYIHLYALNKPGQPSRTVPPVTMQAVQSGKTEGHIANYSSVRFLDFVGDRHTALVSGDQTGLAFFHSLGKVLGLASTDILRILGKYPLPTLQPLAQSNSARLLAMQALPLGTSPHPCDKYHLVALLTRSKLVVAGLKPSARTWWRCTNTDHGTVNGDSKDEVLDTPAGSLAWRPSIDGEPPLLAFCWSKRLHIVRISEDLQHDQSKRNGNVVNGHSRLRDTVRSLCFEPIHATGSGSPKRGQDSSFAMPSAVCSLTWISHRTLFIVAQTHIYLFDSHDLRIYDSAPLAAYSLAFQRTHPGETYSISAYKARLFALCNDGVRIGSILTWADRMLELVEKGDVIAAITAATSYMSSSVYSSGQLASLALPENETERFAVVNQRLRDLLPAASEYVFSEDRLRHAALKMQSGLSEDFDNSKIFKDLATATCRASIALGEFDFLFDDLAEQYTINCLQDLFLDSIEAFVISKDITALPVPTSQKLLARLARLEHLDRLVQLILAVKPECLDLNQVIKLCLNYNLWDALIHVYTEAIHDYVGPMIELFKLIANVQRHRDEQPAWSSDLEARGAGHEFRQSEAMAPHCYRIFDYLAHVLTGVSSTDGSSLPAAAAVTAKSDIWSWLLALHVRRYPSERDPLVLTTKTAKDEPLYPYLMLLLRFDAEATLSCLDAAFEDSFLDRDDLAQHNPHYDRIDRQAIIDVLLSLLQQPQSALPGMQSSFLYIFIARNLPKYPQFLQLSAGAQKEIINGLSQNPEMPGKDDRELAVEFVLSSFPGQIDESLLRTLEQAGFYRALASLYRRNRQYRKLTATLLRDPYANERVFDELRDTIRRADATNESEAVLSEIIANARQLLDLDTASTVSFIQATSPEVHTAILDKISDQPLQQMIYLACLLDNSDGHDSEAALPARSSPDSKLAAQYIELLCDHNAPRVVPFLHILQDADIPQALDICKRAGAVDALVWGAARNGNAAGGISVLAEALQSKAEEIMASLIHGLDIDAERLDRLAAAARIAIQLSTSSVRQHHRTDGEQLFAALIAVLINFQRTCSAVEEASSRAQTWLTAFDTVTMEALDALVATTAEGRVDFPSFFTALASRSEGATYAEYRQIVSSILEAYRFEGDLLSTTRNLVNADLYAEMLNTKAKREAGFRPLSSGLCSICDLPVWQQPTLDDRLRDADVTSRSAASQEVSAKMSRRPSVRRRPSLKGKETDWEEETGPIVPNNNASGLVLFRGGSCFHAVCLQNSQA